VPPSAPESCAIQQSSEHPQQAATTTPGKLESTPIKVGTLFCTSRKQMLPLTTFIHKKLIILNQHTTLLQAARTICENQIGCLLVRDLEGNAAGIVTDRDLVCRGLVENRNQDTPLEEIMSHNLVGASDDGSLSDVVQLMEKHGFRRIPILHHEKNKKIKFVGIVTLDDLIVSKQIERSTLSRIVQKQIGRRLLYLKELKTHITQRSALRSEAHKLNSLY
jgi:CBS domain-containing protein